MAKTTKEAAQELTLEVRIAQCINNFPAPTTTQDTVDSLAAELITANLLRSYAEERYTRAKRDVVNEFPVSVAQARNAAVETMQKSTITSIGVDWKFTFAANKPSIKTDVNDLRTELIRKGVSVDLIDAAINTVSKKSAPALIITASQNE